MTLKMHWTTKGTEQSVFEKPNVRFLPAHTPSSASASQHQPQQ